MSAAEELFSDAYDEGVSFHLDGEEIKCRSNKPIPFEIVSQVRRHKVELVQLLRKRQSAEPYLTESGEFRCRGQWEGDLLDVLLSVGASDAEIERHIDPIGSQYQWQRWEKIKQDRTVH